MYDVRYYSRLLSKEVVRLSAILIRGAMESEVEAEYVEIFSGIVYKNKPPVVVINPLNPEKTKERVSIFLSRDVSGSDRKRVMEALMRNSVDRKRVFDLELRYYTRKDKEKTRPRDRILLYKSPYLKFYLGTEEMLALTKLLRKTYFFSLHQNEPEGSGYRPHLPDGSPFPYVELNCAVASDRRAVVDKLTGYADLLILGEEGMQYIPTGQLKLPSIWNFPAKRVLPYMSFD